MSNLEEIDNRLIKQLNNIQAKLGALYLEIKGFTDSERDFVHKQAFISNLGSSTRIENALLTDVEVEWIDTSLAEDSRPTAFEKYKKSIINKLSKDKERSIEEVVGCREMLEMIYSRAEEFKPLREVDLKGLHNSLLKYYPKAKHYCGKYKPNTNQVVMVDNETGKKTIVLDPASPGPITEAAMRDLVSWYNNNVDEYSWTLLLASEFTFRFLAIHPFQDGNGRMSRALFLLILLQSHDKYLREVSKYIAFDRHIEKYRSEYYLALRQYSNGKFKQNSKAYNLKPIISFFIKSFERSLDDVKVYREKFIRLNELTDTDHLTLNSFKLNPERKLSVSDIEKISKLNKRTIQKSISRLLKNNFLQRLGRGPQIKYQLIF